MTRRTLTPKHLVHGCVLLLIALGIGGCRSMAKTAGVTAVKTTARGAKASAKATVGAAKATGKAAGHVAVGTAHLVFGADDETVEKDLTEE